MAIQWQELILQTIMPCHKIIVLDKGCVVQNGPPLELLQVDGKFRDLCMAAGQEEYNDLLAIAQEQATKDRTSA